MQHSQRTSRWPVVTFAVACVAAAAVVTGCGGDDSGAASDAGTSTSGQTKTLRVAVVPGLGSLPLRVADEKGFFKKQGLELKLTEGADIPTWVAGLGRSTTSHS